MFANRLKDLREDLAKALSIARSDLWNYELEV